VWEGESERGEREEKRERETEHNVGPAETHPVTLRQVLPEAI
jgi:hypothetical protein